MDQLPRLICLVVFAAALEIAIAPLMARSRVNAQPPPTPPIVVDQFGYLPDSPKVAILRDPVVGYDAAQAYTPGPTLHVIDARTRRIVLTGRAVPWKGGKVDPSSGDRTWSFDFGALRKPGRYWIIDPARNATSPPFRIADDVYRPVLGQAVRMLFYQRAGFTKEARFAGAKWADVASHTGPLQDQHARRWSAPDDPATARDLHGGWFDAGDFNRYAPWAGHDIVVLLNAYRERPAIWGDDTNIPESGDGVPDLLNEVKWELDWLVRMQNSDGSVLSLTASALGSPPSSATGQSLYGDPSSYATSSAAGAFALAAKVYGADPRFTAYARDLAARAGRAWVWTIAHPEVEFRQPSADGGKVRLAADAIEIDAKGRAADRLASAAYLFLLTGEAMYRDYTDSHLDDARNIDVYAATALLAYAAAPDATPTSVRTIRDRYAATMAEIPASAEDPYRAFLPVYSWGSNETKSEFGLLFAQAALLNPSHALSELGRAEDYIHYLHGVNPLGKVYLSNMSAFGATNSVDRFFHSWFAEGSRWASVRASPAGPPPGYLVGGPNPGYAWEAGCPQLSTRCGDAPPSPPAGQPPQKSYVDFGTSWPIDSWSVTEPDLLYQTAYIRLLSKFVR